MKIIVLLSVLALLVRFAFVRKKSHTSKTLLNSLEKYKEARINFKNSKKTRK